MSQPATILERQRTVGPQVRTSWRGRVFGNCWRSRILSENVALAKTFSLAAENKRELDVRLEGFNVLNHVQFRTPNTNLSATPGTFGLVTTQANAPRSLQLALKFVF